MKRNFKIVLLLVYAAVTAALTAGYLIVYNNLPDGVSFRYGFDAKMSWILFLLWVVPEIAAAFMAVRFISQKYKDKRITKIILNTMLALAVLALVGIEGLRTLDHYLWLPREEAELENDVLYINSADFLDPYHYYKQKVNAVLQRTLPIEEQKMIAEAHPDLPVDEEGILGIRMDES